MFRWRSSVLVILPQQFCLFESPSTCRRVCIPPHVICFNPRPNRLPTRCSECILFVRGGVPVLLSYCQENLLGMNCYMYVMYTGCPRRNGQNFGRVFLMLNYTDITQNIYIQSWTVTEIMAREVWNFDSCYSLVDYQIHIKTGRNMWVL